MQIFDLVDGPCLPLFAEKPTVVPFLDGSNLSNGVNDCFVFVCVFISAMFP